LAGWNFLSTVSRFTTNWHPSRNFCSQSRGFPPGRRWWSNYCEIWYALQYEYFHLSYTWGTFEWIILWNPVDISFVYRDYRIEFFDTEFSL